MPDNDSDIALLTEHFGYPPVSLLDDIVNAVNLLAERALTSIEQGLGGAPPASLGFGRPVRRPPPPPPPPAARTSRSRPPPPPPPPEEDPVPAIPPTEAEIAAAARLEIENGTHQLETLLCASIDRNFDLLELYVMRNILTVRPEDRDWIRLAHYEGLDLAGGSGGSDGRLGREPADRPTVDSVSALRRRLQTSQRLHAALHTEKARNEILLSRLRSLLGVPVPFEAAKTGGPAQQQQPAELDPKDEPDGAEFPAPAPLAFLRAKGALSSVDALAPVSTATAFNLSQLQSVRTLSAALQAMAPDVRRAGVKNRRDGDHDAVEGEDEDEDEDADEDGPDRGGRRWRLPRAEYVEGAARRHLEIVRGLKLGDQGEVLDGEWRGPGGKGPSLTQVEALEGILATLEGGQPGAADAAGATVPPVPQQQHPQHQ